MRLIDMDTMWKCETCFYHNGGRCNPSIWCEHGEQYRPSMSSLEVIDAVPVVRCKDCKHCFGLTDAKGIRKLLCTEIGKRGLSENDYCSFGVRARENEH